MATCKRPCLYRVPAQFQSYYQDQGCRYIEITGHSRVARVYKLLGVKQMTDKAKELLQPQNCPCFVARLGAGQRAVQDDGDGGRQVAAPTEDARPESGERWRKADPEKIRELYEQGLSDGQIAEKLGCTKTPIGAWRKKWGKAPHLEKHRGKVNPELAMELYLKGKSDREIGEAMDCGHNAIAYWRYRNGLQAVIRGNHYDWSKALPLYEAGATYQEIAKAVGCSKSAVREWVRRLTGAQEASQRRDEQ